jgi:hypothetical protein
MTAASTVPNTVQRKEETTQKPTAADSTSSTTAIENNTSETPAAVTRGDEKGTGNQIKDGEPEAAGVEEPKATHKGNAFDVEKKEEKVHYVTQSSKGSTLKRSHDDDVPKAEKKAKSDAEPIEDKDKHEEGKEDDTPLPKKTQPTFASFAARTKAEATPASSKLGFGAFSASSKPFESASGMAALAEKSDKWTEAPGVPAEPVKTDNVVRIQTVRLPEVDRASILTEITGEEGEKTVASTRVKLYHMVDDQWKERGRGVVKVNVNEAGAARLGT